MLKAKSCSSASWAAGQTLSDPTAVQELSPPPETFCALLQQGALLLPLPLDGNPWAVPEQDPICLL